MANPSGFLLTISLLLTTTLITSLTAAESSGVHHLSWVPMTNKSGSCQGSTAECMANVDDEFDMCSEINRRILQNTKYVSYGALQRDTVPCSRRGASYYKCRPGAEANPYSRGCRAITRSRG